MGDYIGMISITISSLEKSWLIIFISLYLLLICLYSYNKHIHYARPFRGITRFLNIHIITYLVSAGLLIYTIILGSYMIMFGIINVLAILLIILLLIYKISSFWMLGNEFDVYAGIINILRFSKEKHLGHELNTLVSMHIIIVTITSVLVSIYSLYDNSYLAFKLFIILLFFILYISKAVFLLYYNGKNTLYIMQSHLILIDTLLIFSLLMYSVNLWADVISILLLIGYIILFYNIHFTDLSAPLYFSIKKVSLKKSGSIMVLVRSKKPKPAKIMEIMKEILSNINGNKKVIMFISRPHSKTWDELYSKIISDIEALRKLGIAEIHKVSIGHGLESLYRIEASTECMSSICFKQYELFADNSVLIRGVRELFSQGSTPIILVEDLLDFMISLGGWKEVYRLVNFMVSLNTGGTQKIVIIMNINTNVPEPYRSDLKLLYSSLIPISQILV
ncbi:hypothetical protein Shell_0982 [Staphylothermus hellenicus DSM 12710]|uniref:DUF835 domain-containing protein n=2 Tax=Staphylothermus hellenicus TaxID=84599 RepID=D7D8J2_STAHD|nr:hypothetical protein Shell_0982 [Staphylothermus hellenicus DSM 12710]